MLLRTKKPLLFIITFITLTYYLLKIKIKINIIYYNTFNTIAIERKYII